MRALTTRLFWYDALERALKTFLQTAMSLAGVTAVDAFTTEQLHAVSWVTVGTAAGVAAGLSLATSVLSVLQADSISPASIVPPV